MNDHAAKMAMQGAMAEMERRFPGRAVAIFVLPAEQGELAHYASNGPRKQVKKCLMELHDHDGLKSLPPDNAQAN